MENEWLRDGTLVYNLHHVKGYKHGQPILTNHLTVRVEGSLHEGVTTDEVEDTARRVQAALKLIEGISTEDLENGWYQLSRSNKV